ncbi:MAG: hypothetical protein QOH31_5515 [Verrucomicrobiota bacterium]|jgi:hypothetical protein
MSPRIEPFPWPLSSPRGKRNHPASLGYLPKHSSRRPTMRSLDMLAFGAFLGARTRAWKALFGPFGLRANESAFSGHLRRFSACCLKVGGIIPIVAFELESCGQAGISRVTNSSVARLQISYNARAEMQNARNRTAQKPLECNSPRERQDNSNLA